ncbi:MAG TPA: MFS transporter, partial [Gemmata sp.]|nr:MFS transporter [Gemmata sp.]
ALLGIRLLLGIAESSAYPAAAGLIKNWARPEERGRFSSVVAFGGRMGGAIAPWLTAALAGMLAGVAVVEWFISTTPAPADASGKEPANWRGVFVVYGLCGLLVGFVFWLIVRDRPGAPAPSESTPQPERSFVQRVGVLARSRNMWFYGGLQFGVNLGWAFIVTLLPMYLNEVFAIPLEEVGPMQSTALSIGCIGMIFGGVVTDALRQLLGPRLGRSLPIAATLACCAAVFFVIPGLPSAWAVVVALGVMAFCVDLHNPAIWSFAQDVGGKNVGAALGWGNMWGNLGAALSPVVLTLIHTSMGWNSAFVFCAFAFVAAAVCGFLLDATRPIDASDAS